MVSGMQKNNHRQGNIELIRFIVSIIIMTFHIGFIGITDDGLPFSESWIYVEFFFAIMGYFTIAHFDKKPNITLDEKAKASILYTIKKALTFYPYVFISLTIYYMIDYSPFTNRWEFEDIIEFFYDITLMTGVFKDQKSLNGVLWFLSAILVVYPAFSLICQIKARNFFYIISFYIPVLYYGYFSDIEYTRFPMNIVRAFVGLCLGGLVYALANKIKEIKWNGVGRIFLTFMEIGILGLLLLATYKSKSHYRFYIVCFVLGLGIMLSQQTYTSMLQGRLFDWLGKISMTIFIFHKIVGALIQYFCADYPVIHKIILYYVGTILLSLVVYCIVEKIRNSIQKKWRLLIE